MLNLRFILNPGSCGWFCLKHILKRKIKKVVYVNMYDIKKMLNNHGYYCSGLKINDIDDIYCECLTLIKTGKKYNHFIVIKYINDKYVVFYDPLFICFRRWKKEHFFKRWINICLFYTKV